jgi:hypothetical protein
MKLNIFIKKHMLEADDLYFGFLLTFVHFLFQLILIIL